MLDSIPVPMITGLTDHDKLSQVIQYLTVLSDAVRKELSSIDKSNLSMELAQSIDKAITKHQDLSAFASTAYVEKALNEHATAAANTYANKDTVSDLEAKVEDVEGDVNKCEKEIANCVKSSELAQKVEQEGFITETTVDDKLEEFATIKYVDEAIAAI